MCRAVEDYAKERAEILVKERAEILAKEREMITKSEFVNTLLKKGFSLSEALETAGIDEENYHRYSEKK